MSAYKKIITKIQDLWHKETQSLREFLITVTYTAFFVGVIFSKYFSMVLQIGFLGRTYMFRISLLVYIHILLAGNFIYLYVLHGKKHGMGALLVACFPAEIFLLLKSGVQFLPLIVIEGLTILGMLLNDWKIIKDKQKKRLRNFGPARLNYRKIIPKMWRKTRSRIEKAVYIYLTVFCLLIVGGRIIRSRNTYSSNPITYSEIPSGSNIYDMHKEELVLLQEDKYKQLSYQGRINALQTLANCESIYLGIAPVQVSGREIDGSVQGYYNPSARKIVLDKEVINDVNYIGYIVGVLLHELYHAYELDCVRLMDLSDMSYDVAKLQFFREVKAWKEESNHYVSGEGGEESYEKYEDQRLEICANNYSIIWRDETIDYINSIDLSEDN